MQSAYEQLVRAVQVSRDKKPVPGNLNPSWQIAIANHMAAKLGAKAESVILGSTGQTFEGSALEQFLKSVIAGPVEEQAIYTLILVPSHAMAIACDPKSGCFLFDPNTGAYHYDDWPAMLKDLWKYIYKDLDEESIWVMNFSIA